MPAHGFHFRYSLEQLRRYRHIISVLVKYGFKEVAEVLRSKVPVHLRRRAAQQVEPTLAAKTRPARVRLALEELGPTFVKLGQLLSTRPDLVPQPYIAELEKLQDRVGPEDPEVICAELERQLGGKVEQVFRRFEHTAIAAGSIAQVHRATTIEGDEVVVKIRRPHIERTIRAECQILQDIAALLKATLFEHDTVDPQQMARELTEAICREADLANERRNQLRFIRSFAGDAGVHIPRVYEKYCTEAVLTTEYIDGIKPRDAQVLSQAGLDAKLVARRAANFVFRQVFDCGFFHTDPHPGNFFLLENNVLVPIDFGQVAFLSWRDRRLLTEIVLSVVENEPARIVQAVQDAEMLDERTDVNELASDMDQLLGAYRDLPLKDIPVGEVISQAFELMRAHRVRPPAQFALMLKSVMTVEAFAKKLDPEFDIVRTLRPFARQLTMQYADPRRFLRSMRRAMQTAQDMAGRLPADLNAIISKFRQGKFQLRVHHEHLETLTKTLDKSSNRISFALIIAALLVASSILVPQQGTVLGVVDLQTLGVLGYLVAAIIGIWLVLSIIRSRHL